MTSPTIDGKVTESVSNTSPFTLTLSTTNANDIIYVVVACDRTATVTSVTAPSLTFTQRASPVVGGSSAAGTLCVWTAPATAALTGKVITVTMSSGSYDDVQAAAFGVSGAVSLVSPFDPNALVPASAFNNSAAPSVSVTTSNPDDLLLCFSSSQPSTTATPPTGFTLINFGINFGAIGEVSLGTFYKSISAPQSAVTVTSQQDPACFFVDAVTADAGGTSAAVGHAATVLSGISQALTAGVNKPGHITTTLAGVTQAATGQQWTSGHIATPLHGITQAATAHETNYVAHIATVLSGITQLVAAEQLAVAGNPAFTSAWTIAP
jgi:hypothetical protein